MRRIVVLVAAAAAVSLPYAPNAATPSSIRINAGGPAYTTVDGRSFLADQFFTGGGTYSSAPTIAGTSDADLYQDERWGSFHYAVPVTNGKYDVTFHFVELYYDAPCTLSRVFSIDLGDTVANPDIVNLDVCAAAGGPNRALVKTVSGVNVSDGFLDIQSAYGSADDPELAAIEIVPASGAPPDVTAQTPAGGATGVALDTTVTAAFSRAMDGSTITSSTFTLSGPGGTVAASVSYDAGTNRATLTPSAPLANATTYTARLDASINALDGTPLADAVGWSFTTTGAGTLTTLRINAGGPAYTAADGRVFSADRDYTGGAVFTSEADIGDTPDAALYQDERWGRFSYAIPVVNGTYDVVLHFVELYYADPCSGARIFSIDVLDTVTNPDVANVDICAETGGPERALEVTVEGVRVADGVLDLQSAYGAADDPELAAIEVVPSVRHDTGAGGLVAAYSFDAGSGTAVADLSGNGNTGTLSNATWTSAGHTKGALSFDGTDALVSVADSPSLELSGGMTLEAWVEPTALGTDWRTVLVKEQPPDDLAYALYANTGKTGPSAHVFTNDAERLLKDATVLAADRWTHLATSYDGTTLRLYVNGVQVASAAVNGLIAASNGALKIGGNTIWNEWFAGAIDDVRVYKRALTAAEIKTDMNTPVG